ncbi:MAG: hypothetical protein WCB52_20745, partial [Pseudolabrys sp.]
LLQREMFADVRFGSKADMCSALGDVRFVPIADIRNQATQTERPARGGRSETPKSVLIRYKTTSSLPSFSLAQKGRIESRIASP